MVVATEIVGMKVMMEDQMETRIPMELEELAVAPVVVTELEMVQEKDQVKDLEMAVMVSV